MKVRNLLLLLLSLLLLACGSSGSERVPVADLPDPAIYALTLAELPEVGLSWQQTYNQTSSEQGYRWSYLAYQAYQPGNLGVELESAFAVNNDVVLYEVDMRREPLPQPPSALGDIQVVSWKSMSQPHRVGDKSAVWKTNLGEMLTPVWWLEFFQGHAYVRISLFGFPDQIAPSRIYALADVVAARLPRDTGRLRADAATLIATPIPLEPTSSPEVTPVPGELNSTPAIPAGSNQASLPVLAYTAPPGETGMVSYSDDTLNQLSDGVLGGDDLLADNGLGTAYEWVGWTALTDPVTLTFTLPEGASIMAVEIGFNHRDGLGVFVPSQVVINGVSFELPADALPNNQRASLTFTGHFTGPVVTIVLYHRGQGWILVDEVRFLKGD